MMHISQKIKLTHQINIQTDIIPLVEFLIDNIYVEFGDHVSRLLVFQWVLIVPHWWHICSIFI